MGTVASDELPAGDDEPSRASGGLRMTRRADRPESDRLAAAAYIADLSASLAAIARSHGLGILGYILDMAREEAENTLRGDGAGRDQ
jgi:hypothetical protein